MEPTLDILYEEMVLAHKRNKWDTVRYLAPKARELRVRELNVFIKRAA